MKIIINTASTYKGGGVQVARSFIEECRKFFENEYHVIQGEMLSKQINPEEYPDNFSFYRVGYRPATRVFSLKSHTHDLTSIEEMSRPDVVFTTSGPAYWRPKAPHLVGYNLPHYVYKDSPFFTQLPYWQIIKWGLKGAVIKHFFKQDADAFVVQTDDVNQRLRQWIANKNVFTVSNTCSYHYDNPKKVAFKLHEKKEDQFRFLTLSAWYTHKNIGILNEIVHLIPPKYQDRIQFVLTLPEEIYEQQFSGEAKRFITNIGPVKPDEGPSLYKECDALFLPTLLECFSASYAEAMKMGKPIITSDLGFAHTVCGESALYVNPVDPRDILDKIITLVDNCQLQDELVSNGYVQLSKFNTAESRAQEYLRICKQMANG